MIDRDSRTSNVCGAKSNHAAIKVAAAIALAIGSIPAISHALPVIPNASGFGIETPAGRGGVVHRVTNLNASGAGSLKACVDAKGPRVCVFEVSGTIQANFDLTINNPYITIAGQTAPSPGVTWRGGALWVKASEVLVQHMRFRPGDSPDGPSAENRDALKIVAETSISNIVIDHCTFSWAIDENVQLWRNWDNVTISNSIIAEGLHESLNPLGKAGYGMLAGPHNGRTSFTGNLLAHNYARNPLSRASQLVFVNNVVYGAGADQVDLQSEGLVTSNTIAGNVFIPAPDTKTSRAIYIRDIGSWPVPKTSKVYVADNFAGSTAPSDPWSLVSAGSGTVPSTMKVSRPPVWPTGFTRLLTSNNFTYNTVLKWAGARPADRDSADKRVIKQVQDRTGHVINCVSPDGSARCAKNAGGWPVLAVNKRPLSLPANPNDITASGYTNLEVWLHGMSAQVEGRQPSLKAPILEAASN